MSDPGEKQFLAQVNQVVETKLPDFTKHLNIAVVGKVSSGKSSILNALLRRTRENLLSVVAPTSGATTALQCFRLDERVLIVDSPGLDDIERARSEVTDQFLASIDLALLVLTGSADATQKKTCDELRKRSKRVLVVLNMIDQWDNLKASALDAVIAQWKTALGVEEIFPTCAKGFDPETRTDAPYDVRGIDDLRSAVENFLQAEGKKILLDRHMGDKRPAAVGIIVAALLAVAGEAFIPGSAVYITATQAAAIASLNYLYTGKMLSGSSALALLPTFMGRAVGYNLFLFVKSFMPPTGFVDAAAAAVAVVVTFAMLATVNTLLAQGCELQERERLAEVFGQIRQRAEASIREASLADWRSPTFWKQLVERLM